MSNFPSVNMGGLWRHTGWTLFLVAVLHVGSISANHVRMIEGDVPNSGPIEINATDDFVPLCDSFITKDAAVMICEQIGLPSVNVSLNNQDMTNMTANEMCDWSKRNVSDCLMSAGNISECNDNLGISCGGKLRIIREGHDWWYDDYGNGEVEVYHDGKWNRVCADDADFRVARVMCGEMDKLWRLNANGFLYDPESGPFVSVTCPGNETVHADCRIESVTTCMKGFGLQCNGANLQLNATPSFVLPGLLNIYSEKYVPCSFREQIVEEEMKEELGNALASVICSQKGYSRYPAHLRSSYLALKVFMCTGVEDRLDQCTTRHPIDGDTCYTQLGDINVECTASLRLMDGSTDHEGWLEKQHLPVGIWEPVLAPISTTYMASQKICRQLELTGDVSSLMFDLMPDRQGVFCDDIGIPLGVCGGGRVPPEPNTIVGYLGVNCKGTQNDALGNWSPSSTSFLIESFSGSLESNQLVNVLCHELGYQRLWVDVASLANVTEGEGQVFTGLSDRWCVGIEESVEQCHTIIDMERRLTSSQTILSVTCHVLGELPTTTTKSTTMTIKPPTTTIRSTTSTTAVATSQTTTATGNNFQGDIVVCYQGECLTTACQDEVPMLTSFYNVEACTHGKETKCFISGSTTLTFGCALDCNVPEVVRLTNTGVNYCCNSSLCNLEPDTLREIVGTIAGSGSAPYRFTTLSTLASMIVFLTVLFDY